MDIFHQLYLRLTLVQGLCLVIGFGAVFQIQFAAKHHSPATLEHHQPEQPGGAFVSRFDNRLIATSLVFFATWGALAGMTGWMMMREQRRQLLELLHRHDDTDLPDLRLLNNDIDFDDSDFDEDGRGPMHAFAAVPRTPRLRLALGDDSEIMRHPLST